MVGFTFLRIRTHRLLFGAALLTVVLTTGVLAALAAFSGTIGDAGLRQTLRHQAVSQTTVDVGTTVDPHSAAGIDRRIGSALRGAYGQLPTRIDSSTQSGPFALPAALRPAGEPKRAADEDSPDLTVFATFDRSRTVLTAGRMPGRVTARTGTVPVALPETAARTLGLRPGATATLTDRVTGRPVRVEVTGLFRPADPAAAYWRLDPLGGRGSLTVSFTTYGPLLADPSAFASGRLAPARMTWQASADFRSLTTGDVDGLRDRVERTVTRIGRDPASGGAQAASQLPDLLTAVQRTLLTSRSTLLIGTLQLVVLAGLALLLVAGLLAGERAGETSLLRARGASGRRIAGLATGEALLLAVPAALVGPLASGPLVRLLAAHGALARTGTRVGGTGLGGSADAWTVAACTALACAFAVILPTLRRGGTYVGERTARLRIGALPGPVKAGGDLALVAVAAVAYWQLQRRTSGSGVLTADTGGRLGVDPVLVAAPALCLLAGTLLALRLLPLVARLVERRAARGRGLVPALAGWQLSRRPRRGTAPALLLVLAVAMGMFAIGQSASWDRSQRDQADFAAGTDVRVTGMTLPPFGQGGVYDALRARHLGITSVSPANRTPMSLSQDRNATIVSTDAATAVDTLRLRPDLADVPLPALLHPLYAAQDAPGARDDGGFSVPGSAGQLLLDLRLESLDAAGHDRPGGALESLRVTLRDRYGVAYSLYLGHLPADGRSHVLAADLAGAAGTAGSPAGPLRLIGIEGTHQIRPAEEHHRLTLRAVRAVAADGTSTPVTVPHPDSPAPWRATTRANSKDFRVGVRGYRTPHTGTPKSTGRVPLTVEYDLGMQPQPADPSVKPSGTLTLNVVAPPAPPLNGVATDAFLRATGSRVGGTVHVQTAGVQFDVHVTGALRALPTTTPSGGRVDGPTDGGALLLDLRAVNRTLGSPDPSHALYLEPTEWWLGTAPGAAPRVVRTLEDMTQVASVTSRDGVLSQLRSDPLGAGPQSALPALVIAAAVLAAVGFAVSAVGAIRERGTEFAMLRALGASRAQLARMVAVEQGLLALVSLAVGVALGTLLTRLVVPLIVLTAQATQPVPPLLVQLPPAPLAGMLAAVLAVPLLVVAVTALRRGETVSALRQQGDV